MSILPAYWGHFEIKIQYHRSLCGMYIIFIFHILSPVLLQAWPRVSYSGGEYAEWEKCTKMYTFSNETALVRMGQ